MWLLNWLLERVDRVILFFDTLYNRIVDAALNAWFWARDRAQEALNAAVGWINYEIRRISDYFERLIQAAKDWATFIRDSIVNWINTELPKLWEEILAIPTKIRNFVQPYIDLITAWVNEQLQAVTLWFNDLKENIKPLVDAALDWFIGIKQDVLNLVAYFKDGNSFNLLGFLHDIKDDLILLFTDPLAFFDAILNEIILPVLEDALADALGSEEVPLPPRQSHYRR